MIYGEVMKDNKLERFFNAIDFNKDYEEYFTNAKVMDVRLNKELNRMTLLINLDTEVPINVFNELCVKGLNLDGASSVRYKFTINGSESFFDDYFQLYQLMLFSVKKLENKVFPVSRVIKDVIVAP